VTSSEFWLNFGYTIGRVLLGFGLSLFLGAVFGILAGLSHKAYEIIKPMVVIIESVPPIIWIIFAILWFGLGNLPVIFAIMSIVTPIIILNLSHGIQDIDPLLLEMTRSFSIKKRISIARALAIEPDLILMDEPFSDLDFPLRLLLIDHLKEILKAEFRTVLYVTHDIREALLFSHRLYILTNKPMQVKEELFIHEKVRKQGMDNPEFIKLERHVINLLKEENLKKIGLPGKSFIPLLFLLPYLAQDSFGPWE
jgi:hypothetical protein